MFTVGSPAFAQGDDGSHYVPHEHRPLQLTSGHRLKSGKHRVWARTGIVVLSLRPNRSAHLSGHRRQDRLGKDWGGAEYVSRQNLLLLLLRLQGALRQTSCNLRQERQSRQIRENVTFFRHFHSKRKVMGDISSMLLMSPIGISSAKMLCGSFLSPTATPWTSNPF